MPDTIATRAVTESQALLASALLTRFALQAFRFRELTKIWSFGDANRLTWRYSHRDKHLTRHDDAAGDPGYIDPELLTNEDEIAEYLGE